MNLYFLKSSVPPWLGLVGPFKRGIAIGGFQGGRRPPWSRLLCSTPTNHGAKQVESNSPAFRGTRSHPADSHSVSTGTATPGRRLPQCATFVIASTLVLFGIASGAQSIEDQLDALAEEIANRSSDDQQPMPDAAGTEHLEQALLAAGDEFAKVLSVNEFAAKTTAKRLGGGKVSGRLLALVDQRTKSIDALDTQAKSLGIRYDEGLVSVRLTADTDEDTARVEEEVVSRGGEVVATFENIVFARVPVDGIAPLGASDALYFLDADATYHPLRTGFGRRVSEGVGMVKADRLQKAGVTGRGVKVGILDFGFQKYQALVNAGELPRAAASRAFNRARRLEANTVHGTGCAEIIADMAPDAALYLAAVDGAEGQIVAAGQWLASQGVDIINFSGGGHFGPHDGTAVLDRFVDHLVRKHDVLWVNAAGNEGASHWTALARDRNRNGFVDSVDQRYPDLIALSGAQMAITVVWNDWGSDPQRPSSNQDIDAYLLAQSPRGLVPVAASRQVQSGRGVPAEMIQLQGVPRGQVLYLALHMKRVSRPVRTHVFVSGASMMPMVDSHSVGIPATARRALSVAAIDVRNGQLESFSSRGPTDDNRTKPDVSAPDNTASLAYAEGGRIGRFPGTSAAAPHVAGFAALLRQIKGDVGEAGLRQAVQSHVASRGGSSPNTRYGRGLIDGAKVNLAREDRDRGDNEDRTGDQPQSEITDDEVERALREILREQGE